MKAHSVNALLGAVAWETIEKTEGEYDFTELDAILTGAREHGMHLVLLWFGVFKNALSTYVPSWVKRDTRRFPRSQVTTGVDAKKTLDLVSPFGKEICVADSRAFAALMRNLKEVDSETSTVIMVQVENEAGLLGDSRDRSKLADKMFAEPVPEDLLKRLSRPLPSSGSRSWDSVFGSGATANEMFMAHHISSYVGHVGAAGKEQYNLPLFANCSLNLEDISQLDFGGRPITVGGGGEAGTYPSGGPCPHVMYIWQHNAPSIDVLAPDVYLHNYETCCQNYTEQGNPLLIPEQRRDDIGARRVWLAYATYGAIGTAPFGIDTGPEDIGPEYELLSQVQSYLLSAAPADRFGFFFDDEPTPTGKEKWTKVIGEFEVIVERCWVFGKQGPGCGMVIHLGDGRFLLVGRGFQVSFKSTRHEATFTGMLFCEEKEAGENGALNTLGVLNGDETRAGEVVMMPNRNPDYGGFPIAVTIPARTGIAEVSAYWVAEDPEDR